ncbi:hypothetical protein Bbelb_375480 [Branchiostoma belcheri]|nr:hypothetical protein Bbelb_375480 [Branchiostoma belcheri]
MKRQRLAPRQGKPERAGRPARSTKPQPGCPPGELRSHDCRQQSATEVAHGTSKRSFGAQMSAECVTAQGILRVAPLDTVDLAAHQSLSVTSSDATGRLTVPPTSLAQKHPGLQDVKLLAVNFAAVWMLLLLQPAAG